jgi:hypothetical protein
MPPLFRFSDGLMQPNFMLPDLLQLPGEMSKADRQRKNLQSLISMVTISGAMLRMAFDSEYEFYMQCPHTECPYFHKRLCHAYPPVPKDYQSCTFPEWFRDAFRQDLERLG